MKGLIKKTVGFGVEELVEAYTGSERDTLDPSTTSDAVESTLDKLFEEALSEHQARKDSLAAFKNELGELLLLITEHTSAAPPLFVFVDELDRCRPSYAIKLLEEIKHVFGIQNVVYVVSTNIEQLQNAVRALYGAEFDGRRYLHRLFDREYSLPSPDNRQFAKVAIGDSSALSRRKTYTGLPRSHAGGDDATLHDSWSMITDAFELDLRTQRQVFELADDVIAGLNPEFPVHTLWLFFLCALRYVDNQTLERIVRGEIAKHDSTSLERTLKRNISIRYRKPAENGYGDYEEVTTSLSRVLAVYLEATFLSARDLVHKEVNLYDYPNYIFREISAEYGNTLYGNSPPPSLATYSILIRTAGYLAK
jgi:hypothetical protein